MTQEAASSRGGHDGLGGRLRETARRLRDR
jgi:hypothetical protein